MDIEIVKRYTRQMVLPEIGIDGQQAIQDAHIMIVGLGGLGCPAAIYLAAAGIGKLTLNDFDRIDLSNLHRQVLYTNDDVGQYKTQVAANKMLSFNPDIETNLINEKLELDALLSHCKAADIVLDCSDNFKTRHLVNQACVQSKTTLISGAAIRFEGQIAVFNQHNNSPCYACLYPDAEDEAQRCSEVGVIGPLLGVIGSMQALEALKLLTITGTSLDGRLQLFDSHTMQWREVKIKQDPQCPVCSNTR